METISAEASNINVYATLFLVAMSLVMLCAGRQKAVAAVLVTAAFIPLGQKIVVAGLNFYFLRLLLLAGLLRVVMRGELARFKTGKIDTFFVGWVLCGVACGILRGPSAETFGMAYDALGLYLLFRILIPQCEDALPHLRILAYAAVIIAICMCWETMTGRNLFYVLGGVPECASFRDGRFRAQGPFRHSILAGTFGATLLPMMIGLWYQGGRAKRLAVLGAAACTVITAASASSGPLLCYLIALAGFALWELRQRMYLIRRGIVLTVVALAFVMKAPVWFLIGRISEIVGGTGWYRSFLIDQAIRHFGQWWLIGTSDTSNWASNETMLLTPKSIDITNFYIAQGLSGGVLMLILLIAILTRCFKTVGRSVRLGGFRACREKLVWGFGIALAGHCMAFISVAYFDQIKVFLFWLLAVIVSLATYRPAAAASTEATSEPLETPHVARPHPQWA